MSNGAERQCEGSAAAWGRIALARMDTDRAQFAFAFPREADETLRGSVKELGLLVPVAVQECSRGGFRLVCGHRRVAAAEAAGLREVPARRVDPNLTEQSLFLMNLFENTALRPVNDMERALALHRLVSDFGAGITELHSAMARLGLEPSPKILERYTRLIRLSPTLQGYIVSHNIPVRVSTRLAGLSPQDQAVLSDLLAVVPLGGNALRDLLNLAEEIALRDRTGLRQVFSERRLHDIIRDPRHTVSQKRERIKHHLTGRRYPALSARQSEIRSLLKQAVAVSGVSIMAPPYLEGQDLRVAFSFRSVTELRQTLVCLDGAAQREELVKALALLNLEGEV